MGHKQIESTLAYYSLTPAISDIMEFDDIEMYESLIQGTDEEKD